MAKSLGGELVATTTQEKFCEGKSEENQRRSSIKPPDFSRSGSTLNLATSFYYYHSHCKNNQWEPDIIGSLSMLSAACVMCDGESSWRPLMSRGTMQRAPPRNPDSTFRGRGPRFPLLHDIALSKLYCNEMLCNNKKRSPLPKSSGKVLLIWKDDWLHIECLSCYEALRKDTTITKVFPGLNVVAYRSKKTL